jgi:phage antirepressor YoqD-like protein
MSVVAKTLNLGFGRNQIFKLLKQEGYLNKNNEPYQQFCGNKKYFRMIQKQYFAPDGSNRTYYVTHTTPKGIEMIKNLCLSANPNLTVNNIKKILEIAKNMTITSDNFQITNQTEIFAE